MHAEMCPVCHGKGKIWKPLENSTSPGYDVTCHGCGGRGWISVEDAHCHDYYWYPYPHYWTTWTT